MFNVWKRREQYRSVFSGPDGEAVLKHLAQVGYVYKPTYCPGDHIETAHREGMRRLVLSIFKELGIKDDKRFTLVMENFDDA